MTRFYRSGTNHEGRRWTLAPALSVLANQVEAYYPERHGADGTVASERHDEVNPWSDHRPYPYEGAGVVFAIDVGETTENDAWRQAEAIRLSRDPRVKYCIHEDRIFSSYPMGSIPPYVWREYKGPNPHDNHYHLSLLRASANDVRIWIIGESREPAPPKPPTGGTFNVEVTRTLVKNGSRGLMAKRAQSALAVNGFPPANTFNKHGVPDGIFGPGSDTATRNFQRSEDILVDGIIGPVTWSRLEN